MTVPQMKQAMAKARRAAHLEEAAAEVISTIRSPPLMPAGLATLDSAGPAFAASADWLREPDEPLTSPSPPERFPTPSSYSSQVTTPIQPTFITAAASEEILDNPVEYRRDTPRLGSPAPGPDDAQPHNLSTAQVAGEPLAEDPCAVRIDDENTAANGTVEVAQEADFAIYEDSEPER